jgi:hypothetical protein
MKNRSPVQTTSQNGFIYLKLDYHNILESTTRVTFFNICFKRDHKELFPSKIIVSIPVFDLQLTLDNITPSVSSKCVIQTRCDI